MADRPHHCDETFDQFVHTDLAAQRPCRDAYCPKQLHGVVCIGIEAVQQSGHVAVREWDIGKDLCEASSKRGWKRKEARDERSPNLGVVSKAVYQCLQWQVTFAESAERMISD